MTPETDFVRTTKKAIESAWADRRPQDGTPVLVVRDSHGSYWERVDADAWAPLGRHSTKKAGPADPLDVPCSAASLPPGQPVGDPPKAPRTGSVEGFARIIQRLRAQFADGILSARQTEGLARTRVLLDVDGHVWTVGLQSGKWFLFRDGKWHPHADPPKPDDLVRLARARQGCHACGTPLEGEARCTECQAAPSPVLEDMPEHVPQGLMAFLTQAPMPLIPERVAEPWQEPAPSPGHE